MKVIKHIQPKQDMREVRECDCCGAVPQFHSRDFAYFVCPQCQADIIAKRERLGLVDEKGYWRTYTPIYDITPLVKVYKPFRPRKKSLRNRSCDRAEGNKRTPCSESVVQRFSKD